MTKDNRNTFQAKKSFTLSQFVKANGEIVERYRKRIEELRRKNPPLAAEKERELMEWRRQVIEILILPVLRQFRAV